MAYFIVIEPGDLDQDATEIRDVVEWFARTPESGARQAWAVNSNDYQGSPIQGTIWSAE
jgi:hypothetical protein